MKLSRFLAMMIAMVMACASLTSCSDDPKPVEEEKQPAAPSSALIGTWVQTNDYGTVITLTFNEGGTGRINYTYPDGSGDSNENFEYDYDSVDRDLTVIGSQLNGNYDVVVTATILQLTGWTSDGRVVYEFRKR